MEEWNIENTIKALKNNIIFIIIVTVICTIAGYLYNKKYTNPIYSSSTSIILSVIEDTEEESKSLSQDISLNQNLANSYEEIIKSERVLGKVIENLNLDISQQKLASNITVSHNTKSTVLKITMTSDDAELANIEVREVTNVFLDIIKDLYNITNAQILDESKVASSPSNINPKKYAILGALIGLVISSSISVIKELSKKNVKRESDIEENLNIPVLATIGECKEANKKVALNRYSPYGESFRILVSNIKYSHKKVILIVSNAPAEGKSWVSSNLAITYANSGMRTLLIDADIRRGIQDVIFDLDKKVGLSNIIENENKDDITKESLKTYKNTVVENLDIIPRGNANIDYSKLLFSKSLEKIISIVKEEYDFVIIDGTPSSLVADDTLITKLVDTTIIVVKYDNTKISEIEKIKNKTERAGGNILGAIINCMPNVRKKYYKDYYNYNNILPLQAKQAKHSASKK